jgi:formylglycine-generating enzyme required for sulfatase activity
MEALKNSLVLGLGYSFKGKFPFEDSKQNILLHLVQWDIEARLRALSRSPKEYTLATILATNESWDKYASADEGLVGSLSSSTQWPDPAEYGSEGWIKTNWHQDAHYNSTCPLLDPEGTERCAVGCVATAMAQIINYWKYPGSVTFSGLPWYLFGDAYTSKGDAGNIDIDGQATERGFPTFGQLNSALSIINYDGNLAEESYLCFGAGIKLRMNYGPGSGSNTRKASGALTDGFSYGSAKSSYILNPWSRKKNTVIGNIKKGWPAQIGIRKTGQQMGHSVVLDGYRESDEFFHVNMGWSGTSEDTWYNIPSITSYDVVHTVVYDICPYQGWSQYGADEKNTFRAIYTAPTSDQIKDKWYITPLDRYHFSGLVVGTGNKIYASIQPMDLNQGYHPGVWIINQYGEREEEYYLTSEDESISYPVQNSKGEVFVGTGEGGVYKIDTKNKTTLKIFQDPANGEFHEPKVDKDDYLYFVTVDKLFCLNSNGIQRWGTPFQPGSGKKMWRGLPAIDVTRNNIYVGYYESTTKKSYLGCVNRQNGALRYQKEFTDIAYSSRMTGVASIGEDGTLYVGCYNNLYAFTPGLISFTQKWVRLTNSIITDAPVIGEDGTLYVTYWQQSGSNWYYRFNALNPANGNDKWTSPIDLPSMGDYDNVLQPYAAANNVVIFSILREQSGPDTFEMYAYRDEGNHATLLWNKDWGTDSGSDVAFGPGGTLYILPGGEGKIYAVSDGPRGDPDGGGMAFTDNARPNMPSDPTPVDEAADIAASVMLSWTCSDPEEHSLRYALFVGESGYDMVPVDANITGTSYMLSGLKAGTGYAWKIIATDGQAISEGPTWVFSTKPPNPDLNADGRVNFIDFAKLAAYWDQSDWTGPENLDWVGDVDFVDMHIIAENWLREQSIPSEMVFIPAGTFQMGDSKNEGYSRERPVHTVTLGSYYISKYEIALSEYRQYLNSAIGSTIYVSGGEVYGSGNNQLYCDTSTADSDSQIAYSGGVFTVRTKGVRNMSYDPMGQVSWYGAVAYCNWRSQQDGYEQCYNLSTWVCDFNKKGYRLATEAEWEYAARGGLVGNRFPWGDTISQTQANFYSSTSYLYDESPVKNQYHPLCIDITYPYTSPVGFFDGTMKYKADYQWPGSATSYQTTIGMNNFDLYDMAGNVWEWCNDWYSGTYYSSSPPNNPTGPTSGSSRVLRGGDWYDSKGCWCCRVANRNYGTPATRYCNWGFRVVLDLN